MRSLLLTSLRFEPETQLPAPDRVRSKTKRRARNNQGQMGINWAALLIGAVVGFSLLLPFYIDERNERKREVASTEPKIFEVLKRSCSLRG